MAAYRTRMPLREYQWTLFCCLFSAIILRTSACTINDIFDRKLDAGVGESNILNQLKLYIKTKLSPH